jgi:hypothetical protein
MDVLYVCAGVIATNFFGRFVVHDLKIHAANHQFSRECGANFNRGIDSCFSKFDLEIRAV